MLWRWVANPRRNHFVGGDVNRVYCGDRRRILCHGQHVPERQSQCRSGPASSAWHLILYNPLVTISQESLVWLLPPHGLVVFDPDNQTGNRKHELRLWMQSKVSFALFPKKLVESKGQLISGTEATNVLNSYRSWRLKSLRPRHTPIVKPNVGPNVESNGNPQTSLPLCEDCGCTIPVERFDFVPNATRCTECQNQKDSPRFRQLDASEKWFPRLASSASTPRERKRRNLGRHTDSDNAVVTEKQIRYLISLGVSAAEAGSMTRKQAKARILWLLHGRGKL